MRDMIEAQDCRACAKRDDSGGCTKPGLCIYVDKLADGTRRMKEDCIDPQKAERLGESSYLSMVEKLDIAKRKRIFKTQPILKDIITLLIAGATYSDIEKALHVHRRTISKAKKMWMEMKEGGE